ncbi:MAG: hypothetical protein M1814_002550 [Vezdaea aestivalis]|nr:MAG: hypothetical protein M1814_002550 [Vezdaea aestivalis]
MPTPTPAPIATAAKSTRRAGPSISFGHQPKPGTQAQETSSLLADDELAEETYLFAPLSRTDRDVVPNPHCELPVYENIHRVRHDIIHGIDDPYSLEQLKAPRINVAVVRPLVDKFYKLHDISIVYCLLVNRAQFLREQGYDTIGMTVTNSRALLCELIAVKILRRLDEDNPGSRGLLLLANVLVAGFDPFQNCPPGIRSDNERAVHWASKFWHGRETKLTTLEVAIITESKLFLSSLACQKVVNAIYKGQVIYTPTSWIDILPDRYKIKPISLYDPGRSHVLNQYRLIVPRTRNILEVCQFITLLVLYILVMANRSDTTDLGRYEIFFSIYAVGWVLDQFASMLEHGWAVYTQNLWSFLDVTFVAIFVAYLITRAREILDNTVHPVALDILAMGAPVMIPRLAFNIMSENMLFVTLRAMMADFTLLTILALWCFAGFLLSMTWMNGGPHQPITVSKWMLWIWFGLDGTGIQRSVDFHWLLGPILMVTFAFLGNTLFLTILVSMLSNTFSTLVGDAAGEIQFRRAVLTFEGVKSDAIFAYQPPFNIVALIVLFPLHFLLSPRWFHKINITAVRTINFPILLTIALFERYYLWAGKQWDSKVQLKGLHTHKHMQHWGMSGFSVHGDIQAVFEAEPPQSMVDEFSSSDDGSTSAVRPILEPAIRGRPVDGKPDKKSGKRTGSMFSDHVSDFLHFSGDNKERLEALEQSNRRIEKLLGRILDNFDDGSSSEDRTSKAGSE